MKDPHFWAFFALLALGFVIWRWEAAVMRPVEDRLQMSVPGGSESTVVPWN